MSILISIIVFIVTVLALVTVHEYGHFWVARKFGFKVQKFSIGFGKAIVRWFGKDGTEYVIAILPLGGYVKMLDEREGEVSPHLRHMEFNQKPVWSRFLVVAAGPGTNILFALIAFWLMFVIGVKQVKPVIGNVIPNSISAQAGLRSQQQIIGIDGKPMKDWQDIILAIVERMGEKGSMAIQVSNNDGSVKTHQLNLNTWDTGGLDPQPLMSLGFEPYQPFVPAIIANFDSKGAASKAGMKIGDKVLSVDGKKVKDWETFVRAIQNKPDAIVKLIVLRNKTRHIINVKTEQKRVSLNSRIGYIGVQGKWVPWSEDLKFEEKYSVFYAWIPAWQEVWRLFDFNAYVLWKLIRGQISLASLGGPITIYKAADVA